MKEINLLQAKPKTELRTKESLHNSNAHPHLDTQRQNAWVAKMPVHHYTLLLSTSRALILMNQKL